MKNFVMLPCAITSAFPGTNVDIAATSGCNAKGKS